MNNNMSLEEVLKLKIEKNKTYEAISLLKKEIVKIFIKKLETKNKEYKYMDIIQLANNIEKYLTKEEILIFKKYYVVINENNHELYELNCLVDIYNKLKKEK